MLVAALKEKLAAGEPQFGMGYSWPCPGLIEATAAHFDFCWIDAQHGPWDLVNLTGAVRACDLVGRPALLRVADHTYGRIGQALDLGPAAVILPCVETAEQARAIVDAACFPPVGNRSFGGRRMIDRHGPAYVQDPGLQPLVIAQIETPRGLDAVAEIAAVPGIDALFFGPDDMKLRLGLPLSLTLDAPEILPAARAVAVAARRQGKVAMTVPGTPAALRAMLEAGYLLLNVAGDSGLLRAGAKNAAAMVAGVLAERA